MVAYLAVGSDHYWGGLLAELLAAWKDKRMELLKENYSAGQSALLLDSKLADWKVRWKGTPLEIL